MKYLIFNTEEQALDRSHEIAINEGCNGVTKYWFGVIKHPIDDNAAMEVSEDEVDKLNTTEQDDLKNRQYMEDNGWFPIIETI